MNTYSKYQTCLLFLLNNEFFALSVLKVLEVLQKQKMTRVPNVGSEVMGMINFRGEIIPVFNIRQLFGFPQITDNKKSVIIVVEYLKADKKQIGAVVVDKVKDVFLPQESQLQEAPKLNTNFREGLVEYVYKRNEDFIMMLNSDNIFQEL